MVGLMKMKRIRLGIVADELSTEQGSDVVVAGSGRVKKCLNSSNVRSGPACNIFGVPGHPIRTVRG